MGTVTKCPDCGKLIALAFPLHDCTPSKRSKRRVNEIREEIKTCSACADQSSIAAPGQTIICRTHQRALDAYSATSKK